MPDEDQDLLALTAEIVSAHVANNRVHTSEVASLIGNVHAALSQLAASTETAPQQAQPQAATTARKSLSRSSHIISMIDGKPYKMLRRHISQHGYTPESYREAFGLPHDYPMVARDYAEKRRTLAHAMGLGRKGRGAGPTGAAQQTASGTTSEERDPAPAKRPRRKLKTAFAEAVATGKEPLAGE